MAELCQCSKLFFVDFIYIVQLLPVIIFSPFLILVGWVFRARDKVGTRYDYSQYFTLPFACIGTSRCPCQCICTPPCKEKCYLHPDTVLPPTLPPVDMSSGSAHPQTQLRLITTNPHPLEFGLHLRFQPIFYSGPMMIACSTLEIG